MIGCRSLIAILFTLQLMVASIANSQIIHGYSSKYYDPSKQFKYEDLLQVIRDNKLTNIDDLLSFFKKNKKLSIFLTQYALQHSSRSLFRDAVSWDYPRVIMHNNGTILAFTTDPNQAKAYNSLEIISYRDGAFHFAIIDFNKFEESVQNQSQRINECRNCHGQTPRPIWPAYNIWPGSVGEVDDGIYTAVRSQNEVEEAERDYNNKKLIPYLLNDKKWVGRLSYLDSSGYQWGPERTEIGTRPNLLLLKHVAELNYERMFSQISNSPYFNKFKYLMLAALIYDVGDDEFKSYLPHSDRKIANAVSLSYLKNQGVEASETDDPLQVWRNFLEQTQYKSCDDLYHFYYRSRDMLYPQNLAINDVNVMLNNVSNVPSVMCNSYRTLWQLNRFYFAALAMGLNINEWPLGSGPGRFPLSDFEDGYGGLRQAMAVGIVSSFGNDAEWKNFNWWRPTERERQRLLAKSLEQF